MIGQKISTVIALCLAIFLAGLACIALSAIYDFVTVYQESVFSTLLVMMRITGAIIIGYFGFNLWLSVEYRAIENERFKKDGQVLELASEYPNEEITLERKMCEMFDNMKFTNSLSINEIAKEFYGNSGGKQNQKVKNILIKHGREI